MIKFVLISSSKKVISFGFETEQHKFLCNLSKLGLSAVGHIGIAIKYKKYVSVLADDGL